MSKKKITRKKAIQQMGSIAIGSQLAPFIKWDLGQRSESQEIKSPVKNHEQPHIIFIMTDQQRADALGSSGNKAILTPHLDQLAKEGVAFTQTYSPTPSCTPARAALLTGMNPWNNGMLGYGRLARKYKYELPRMLREGGYYTFGIGKNHWFPQKSLHGFHGTLVDESGRIEQDGFVSEYRDWFKTVAPGQDPDKTGIGWNSRLAKPYALNENLHPTHWTGEEAVRFLANYDLDKPLFLKISFARPHSPYDPPQRYLDKYKNIEMEGPAIGDWEGEIFNYPHTNKPIPTTGDDEAAFGNFGEEQVKESKKHYYASITFIDDQVGKIINQLKKRGMYDHSLIVFLSDHGDEMGDHYRWRKTFPYQGSVHIPHLLRWPTNFDAHIERGTQIDNPIGLQDILPTFLETSLQDVPEDMDGKSVLPLIKNEKVEWRSYIGLEHASTYFENNYWAAVTDGKRKYIWYFFTGQEQFFNLEDDAQEKSNLIVKEAYQKQIENWRNHLIDYLAERGDGFVRNGKLVLRKENKTYSPNYPKNNQPENLAYWKNESKSSFLDE